METIEIYLGSNRKLRAPLFIYRIVIDVETNRSAAFIGVNNPHLKREDIHKYEYCTDKSSDFHWSVWYHNNGLKKNPENTDELRKGHI